MIQNKYFFLLVIVLSLPIMLPVLNPSMEMGAMGMILGGFGTFVSPVIIFGTFGYLLVKALKGEK